MCSEISSTFRPAAVSKGLKLVNNHPSGTSPQGRTPALPCFSCLCLCKGDWAPVDQSQGPLTFGNLIQDWFVSASSIGLYLIWFLPGLATTKSCDSLKVTSLSGPLSPPDRAQHLTVMPSSSDGGIELFPCWSEQAGGHRPCMSRGRMSTSQEK